VVSRIALAQLSDEFVNGSTSRAARAYFLDTSPSLFVPGGFDIIVLWMKRREEKMSQLSTIAVRKSDELGFPLLDYRVHEMMPLETYTSV